MPEFDNSKKSPTSSDFRYLEKLEFDPKLRQSWLNFFVSNFRVVILMIILISAWGIYSFSKLPLESNPEVTIPYAIITSSYPGASPTDVEELLTKKIETKISGIKGIKQITSSSSNSFSNVAVEFESDINQDDAIRKLRDEVNSVKSDLPEDASEPVVTEASLDDTPIFTFSLTGPFDGFELRSFAEKIQNELEKIAGVREVSVSGGDEREFKVAYDPEKLSFFNISPAQVNQAIAASNIAVPGGNFEGQEFNYPVRTDGRFYDQESLKNIPILHTEKGAVVYLKDIAQVEETAIKKTAFSRFSIGGETPQNSITVSIIKKTGNSIVDTVSQAQTVIDKQISRMPEGVKYDITVDLAKQINEDFKQLTHDFLLTLALVMGVLFLIVGLKESLVAGLAIPLVFFITFGIMHLTGITLNFLSIFSLILSLGLLVDDAIVVVSATKQYMKSGKYTPEEAVLLVLNDFKVVLTTTTLATTWAFLPLLLSTGIIGSFIKSIPITVSVTLVSSLLVALMINHPLAAVLERVRLTKKSFFSFVIILLGAGIFSLSQKTLLGIIFSSVPILTTAWMLFWYFVKKGKLRLAANQELVKREWKDDQLIKEKLKKQGQHEEATFGQKLIHGIIHFDKVIPIYEKYLRGVLRTRKRRLTFIFATLAIFIFSVLLPVFGIVPSEFFPPADQPNIFVSLEAPIGTKLETTSQITSQVENKLLAYPEIVNFSTVVGKSGGASHKASITVTLKDKKERTITSYALADKIRQDVSSIKEAKVTVESQSGGPPSGSAFEAHIIGDDLQTLDKITTDLKGILSSIPGVVNIDASLKDAPAEYTFILNHDKMELYGLNSAAVGSTLRMAISGTDVSTVIRGNKEIKINAILEEDKIPTLEALQNLQILNNKNQPVFLKDVANIKLEPSVETINRVDQRRVEILTAGVSGNTRSTAVVSEFQKKLAVSYTLPEGYTIEYGGESQQNNESVASIFRAMAIAAVLIVSTMVIQFNSFRKSLIVLITMPLSLIGSFIGMAILGINLSFPALIGILALFGIVVKNAIILIDKMNLNIRFGIPFSEAVIDAGKSRIEAIFITSICTIFGILPITLSNETWQGLGSAIIFGLMLSSFLTLFLVPVLFITLVKNEEEN